MRALEPGETSKRQDRQDITARSFTALDGAMLGALALQVAGHIVAATLRVGWGSAAILDILVSLWLLGLALRPAWRPLLLRLLAFGLIAGVCELFTDFSGEVVAHSLSYPPNEPMLWASPIYMPLAWMVTLSLIGYLAWRLDTLLPERRGLVIALTGLWGALNIPFYEEMAYSAGWWRYAHGPGLFHTPYYVMLFEGLIAAALPLLLAQIERRRLRATLLRGVILGAWMPCAALVAWLLIGR